MICLVREIVDHHIDLKIAYSTLEAKEIELVGSTCTLVADRSSTPVQLLSLRHFPFPKAPSSPQISEVRCGHHLVEAGRGAGASPVCHHLARYHQPKGSTFMPLRNGLLDVRVISNLKIINQVEMGKTTPKDQRVVADLLKLHQVLPCPPSSRRNRFHIFFGFSVRPKQDF